MNRAGFVGWSVQSAVGACSRRVRAEDQLSVFLEHFWAVMKNNIFRSPVFSILFTHLRFQNPYRLHVLFSVSRFKKWMKHGHQIIPFWIYFSLFVFFLRFQSIFDARSFLVGLCRSVHGFFIFIWGRFEDFRFFVSFTKGGGPVLDTDAFFFKTLKKQICF